MDIKGLSQAYEYRINENKMILFAFEKKFSNLMIEKIEKTEQNQEQQAWQQQQLASQIADLNLKIHFIPNQLPLSKNLP